MFDKKDFTAEYFNLVDHKFAVLLYVDHEENRAQIIIDKKGRSYRSDVNYDEIMKLVFDTGLFSD